MALGLTLYFCGLYSCFGLNLRPIYLSKAVFDLEKSNESARFHSRLFSLIEDYLKFYFFMFKTVIGAVFLGLILSVYSHDDTTSLDNSETSNLN
jgi:hypothetical protein